MWTKGTISLGSILFLAWPSLKGLGEISWETQAKVLSACFIFSGVSEPGFFPQAFAAAKMYENALLGYLIFLEEF